MLLRLLTLPTLLSLNGCVTLWRSPVETSKPIEVEASAYRGTVLGPNPSNVVNAPARWQVKSTLLALKQPPGLVFKPLSAQGRLFAQPAVGDPVAAYPQLTSGIRFGSGAGARSWFNACHDPLSRLHAGVVTATHVLSDGITVGITIRSESDESLEIRLQSINDQDVQLFVSQQGTLPPSEDEPQRATRESVLVDPMTIDPGKPIVLAVPMELGVVKGVAVRLDFGRPTADEAFADAERSTQQLLEQSEQAAAARPARLPVQNDAWSGYELVLQSSGKPAKRRAAMNFIAAQTEARIAQDLILVADEATLEQLHQTVLSSMSTLNREGVLLGWLMDFATLKLCADRAAAGPLPPQMVSVLTMHLGEAGRNAGSLPDLIKGVTTREELQTRAMVENLIYLEDSSPAARVRAYDYLAARGRAPAGYDPLGSPQQRRQALEQPATQPATSEAKP